MKRYVVDRIEGEAAVCEAEGQTTVEIALRDLPKGVREGDFLVFDGKGYTIDKAGTEAQRRKVERLMDELFVD